MTMNAVRFGGVDATTGRPLGSKPTPAEQAAIRQKIIDNLPATVDTLKVRAQELTQLTADLQSIASGLEPLKADYFDKKYPNNPSQLCFTPPGM